MRHSHIKTLFGHVLHSISRPYLAMVAATIGSSFSDMKQIKDHLRNRLLSTSLSQLMTSHVLSKYSNGEQAGPAILKF